MTSESAATRGIGPIEYLALAVCFLLVSVTSYRLQHVSIDHQWDAASYEELAQQVVEHQPLSTNAPFVYRIGWPWTVAKLFPHDITGGFKLLNIIASAAGAVVFLWWLNAAGIRSRSLRLLLIALYLAIWQGPTRFVYFYPALIDPPLLLFIPAGLLLVQLLSKQYSLARVVLLAAVCFVGTLCRESMVLVPGCFLFVNNPLTLQRIRSRSSVPIYALALPFLASAAALALAHLSVVPAASDYTFRAAIVEMLRQKPLFTVLLGVFLTFGPIVAIVAYDYRATIEFLWSNQYLAAFLGADLLLAYIGGTDTERILLWAAPAVYLLLGRSLARHARILSNTFLIGVLVVGQAISARLFWAVPDPSNPGGHAALIGHIIGLDAPYFSLWSYFAPGSWRLLQFALYTAGAAIILVLMWPMRTAQRQSSPVVGSR